MAPFLTRLGVGGGNGGFGFGRKKSISGVPRGTINITNISPALPNGQTDWSFASDGNLVINDYSSRSFEFTSPMTRFVTVFGAGSGSYVAPTAVYLGGSGGAIRAQVNFTSGTTYWIHVGEGGGNNPAAIGGGGIYAGGGASALTLGPNLTGTEILVAGGGGGNINFGVAAPFTFPFTSPYSHGSGASTGLPSSFPGPPGSGAPASGSTGGLAGAASRSANATPGGNAPRGAGGNAGFYAGSSGSPSNGGRSGYARGGSDGSTLGDGPGCGGGGGYAGGGGTNNAAGSLGSGGGGNGYFNPLYVVVPSVVAVNGLSVFNGPVTYPIPSAAFANPSPINPLGPFPTSYGSAGGGNQNFANGSGGSPGAFIIQA